jgi:hypothetical protein
MTVLRILLAGALLVAAAVAQAAEPVYPPGSRIGLAPPDGLEPSRRFTGFESPAGAAITLVEMPPEAAADLLKGFSTEAIQAQGFTETARETVKVGAVDATLLAMEQTKGEVSLRKWLLVVPDPTVTAFVLAQALQGVGAQGAAPQGAVSDEAMRAALRSVAVRPPLPIEDRVAALPFRLTERAEFRPVRVLAGNALLLTDGPKDVTQEMEQPLLIVALSTNPGPPADQRDAFARAALNSNASLREIFVERSQGFRQRGAEWHEIVARATDVGSGRPVVVMQTIRWDRTSYLRMVGVARADARDAMLPRFRRVVDGVEAE